MKTRQNKYSFALAHSEVRTKHYVYFRKQWWTQKFFMGGFIQWHMVVFCIWCALLVTSQF